MAENLDLLGDPIPENWGGRGRPPHKPTDQNRNKVMLLLALGWADAKIAASLGITPPTLRKHYFRELKVRDEGRARLEARLIAGMAAKALAGDVPAYREIRRALDRADLEASEGVYVAPQARAAKPVKLGKKAERLAEAEKIGGIYSPGPPPSKFVN